MPDLKLGSNWKSCGYHYDMRRFNHGNARINFGFSKGDDNYGGVKRKELDDFCKSLGKTMNLVMYRMQDTENLRMKLRERRRQEDRERAARAEKKDQAWFARTERNKRWRECKEKEPSLYSIKEDDTLTEDRRSLSSSVGSRMATIKKVDFEKEERRMKNREWREKREGSKDVEDPEVLLSVRLTPELVCAACQEVMGEPGHGEIYQCEERHNFCQGCWSQYKGGMEECCVCSAGIMGRNVALEQVAAILYARILPLQDSHSFSFTPTQEYVEATAPMKEEDIEDNDTETKKYSEKSTVSEILTEEIDQEEDDEDLEEEVDAMTPRRK